MRRSIWAVLLCLAALPALAADGDNPTTQQILSEQQAIRAGIASEAAPYAALSQRQRNRILNDQDRLSSLLEGTETPQELTPERRAEALNLQSRIAATIRNDEDQRMVCQREVRTGSLMVNRTCRTKAQARAEREQARQQMQVNPGICNSRACVGD